MSVCHNKAIIPSLMNDVNFPLDFPIKCETFYFANPLQNWSYVLYWDTSAVVIDPFESTAILHFLKNHSLNLTHVLNTHKHFDHIGGNLELLAHFPQAQLIDTFQNHSLLASISFPREVTLEAISTPGHCRGIS